MEEVKEMKTISFNGQKYKVVDGDARKILETKASTDDVNSAVDSAKTEVTEKITEAQTSIEGKITGVQTDTAYIKKIIDENRPKRYGFCVKIDESDPEKRVEYLYDAVGMEPAKMNFNDENGGTFSYGDWQDVWFVARNYPVVLNPDGSEAYRLDPNDYSKREDGDTTDNIGKGVTLTDLTNGRNAMSAIPLVWIKRWHEHGYRYVSVCETQYDESYKAYAHTNANGVVQPYAYHAIYEGYLDGCSAEAATNTQAELFTACKYKTDGSCTLSAQCTAANTTRITDPQCKNVMRSVSGVYPTCFTTTDWERASAQRNGAGWDLTYWSLNELIADLLTLMGKNCNTQAVFGQGHTERNTNSTTPSMMMLTGTLDKKGQFWGSSSTKPTATQAPGDTNGAGSKETGVKVFHIENFWGDRWTRQLGMMAVNGDFRVKMTPEYNTTGDGYVTPIDHKLGTGASSGYRKETIQTEYGALPIAPYSGSDSTYETDYFWGQADAAPRVSVFGGSCNYAARCGARCWSVNDASSGARWFFGGSLSYLNTL